MIAVEVAHLTSFSYLIYSRSSGLLYGLQDIKMGYDDKDWIEQADSVP